MNLKKIFGTVAKAGTVEFLLKHPDEEFYIKELAEKAGVPRSSLYRDIKNLVEDKVVRERIKGKMRLIKLNKEHPVMAKLLE